MLFRSLARLRQELAGEGGEKYLEAVIYEGLRRRPSNLFTSVRQVKQPFSLGGYELPAGTLIAVCIPALSMRDDLFPNPRSFDPDHFYGKEIPASVWSPFGDGPHACTGRDLAMAVMKTALATVVRRAELKLVQDEVRPVRVAYYYEPNKGLLVTLEKRL